MPRRDKRLARKPGESHCTTRGCLAPKLPIVRANPLADECYHPWLPVTGTGSLARQVRRNETKAKGGHPIDAVESRVGIFVYGQRKGGEKTIAGRYRVLSKGWWCARDSWQQNLRASLNHLCAALFFFFFPLPMLIESFPFGIETTVQGTISVEVNSDKVIESKRIEDTFYVEGEDEIN